MTDQQMAIQVRDIHRTYTQGDVQVKALRGVTLEIERGAFAALVGPSGSGKTTLLNIIGLLDHPDQGHVMLGGHEVSNLSKGDAAEFRLEHVGFVFQAYNLVPVLSAYENAEFTLLLRGMDPDARRETVMPLLERVGLKGMEHRRPHELSGGQQQRVAVVRALATSPEVVLADEPTANLDSATSADLMTLMRELNRDLGTTFLFSTHDQVVIERAELRIHLLDGQVEKTT